jgi:hypothetical protein
MNRFSVVLFATAGLAACSPQPRSAEYFVAHPDEAARVAADCKSGSHRGEECANATAGVAAAESAERMELYKKSF